MSYLIVGLGNPGEKYQNTRHNAGRIVAGEVEKRLVDNKKVKFLTPDTVMNNSGKSLAGLIKNKKQASQLIVLHDDLDLPLGKMKISFNRGAGGHRGLASVVKQIKTTEFVRVRFGISPVTPSGKIKKPIGEQKVLAHILGDFKPAELKIIKNLSKKATLVVETIIKEGKDKAMTLYN